MCANAHALSKQKYLGSESSEQLFQNKNLFKPKYTEVP